LDSWAYQGVYCSQCDVTHRYSDWSAAKRGGLIFIGTVLIALVVFLLFFLPLFPRVEAAIQHIIMPAVTRMEAMLSSMAAAARPKSAGPPTASRPGSAAIRPTSAGNRVMPSPGRVSEGLAPPPPNAHAHKIMLSSASLAHRTGRGSGSNGFAGNASLRRVSSSNGLHGGLSRTVRRSSHTVERPAADVQSQEVGLSSPAPRIRVHRPSRLRIFLDLISEPVRSASCCVCCVLCADMRVCQHARV
jgi:hypothetical protein